MLEIVPCTSTDAATIAALWNERRQEAASCWSQAVVAEPAMILSLLAMGLSIHRATRDGVPVGFGLWSAAGEQSRLVALAAENDADYYALLAAFCQWSLAQGRQRGFAELGTAATVERARMDALGAIEYTPVGFEPVLPGRSLSGRVPSLWRAACDCEVLLAAIATLQEGQP